MKRLVLAFAAVALLGLAAQAAALEPCIGIRPGALFATDGWTDCTANFVYAAWDGIYVGTAAHCVPNEGAPTWFYYPSETMPQDAPLRDRLPDAHVAFMPPEWHITGSRYDPELAAFDLAFIQIEEHMHAHVDPQMCGYAAPTGIFLAPGNHHERMGQYGHGIGFHGSMEARPGVGPKWDGGALFHVYAVSTNGDSGGPWIILETGEAVGHETAGGLGLLPDATDEGIHLKHAMAVAEAHGLFLQLVLMDEDPIAKWHDMRNARAAPVAEADVDEESAIVKHEDEATEDEELLAAVEGPSGSEPPSWSIPAPSAVPFLLLVTLICCLRALIRP